MKNLIATGLVFHPPSIPYRLATPQFAAQPVTDANQLVTVDTGVGI